MKKSIIFFLLLFCSFFSIYAQRKLSLPELLLMAEESELRQADTLAIASAIAEEQQARTAFYPRLSAQASYFRIQRPLMLFTAEQFFAAFEKLDPLRPFLDDFSQRINEAVKMDLHNTFFVNFSLVQPLFMGGKLNALNKMASTGVHAQRLKALKERADRQIKIEKDYYDLIKAEAIDQLFSQYIKKIDTLVYHVEMLKEEGYANKADLLEMRLLRSKIVKEQANASAHLPILRKKLAIDAGLGEEEEITPATTIEQLEEEAHRLLSPGTISPDDSLRESTKEQLLDMATNIEKQKIIVAQADMLPRVAAMANYTLLSPNPFNGMTKKMGGSWSLGITLQIPITEILSGYYARKAAKLKATIAEIDALNKKKLIALERSNARAEMEHAQQAYSRSIVQKEDAQENLQLAEEGYHEGVVDMEKYVRALSNWLEVASTHIISLTELFSKYSFYRYTQL